MRQTIESYLRSSIHLNINKFLESSRCSICGKKNNLVFHHNKGFEFAKILHESLNMLDYEYKKFVDEYSKKEIDIIELIILGKHVCNWHVVVCNNCHIEGYSNHKSYNYYYKRYKNQIDFYRKSFPNSSLDDFIDNFNYFYLSKLCIENINKELYSSDIDEFKKLIKDNIIPVPLKNNCNYRHMGIRIINKILQVYSIPYILYSKRNYKKGNFRLKWYWKIKST
jgi:hypothetical protein